MIGPMYVDNHNWAETQKVWKNRYLLWLESMLHKGWKKIDRRLAHQSTSHNDTLHFTFSELNYRHMTRKMRVKVSRLKPLYKLLRTNRTHALSIVSFIYVRCLIKTIGLHISALYFLRFLHASSQICQLDWTRHRDLSQNQSCLHEQGYCLLNRVCVNSMHAKPRRDWPTDFVSGEHAGEVLNPLI